MKKIALYLHSQNRHRGCKVLKGSGNGESNAEIAQLVEHNLAKVGVASSSLVFRSRTGEPVGFSYFVSCISETRRASPIHPFQGSGV